MPTILGHAVVGAAIADAGTSDSADKSRLRVVAAICAAVPDADIVTFALGIPYSSVLGHRGLSHSLLGAAVIATVGTLIVRRGGWRFGVLTLLWVAVASHGLLDAMTNGGLGVAFFTPFKKTRYFLPWRPIVVSPLGIDRFEDRAPVILGNELLWVWLPAAIVAGACRAWRGMRSGPTKP